MIAKQVYSTYHVWFIKHQDNHNTDLITMMPTTESESPPPTDTPSIGTIARGASDQPFSTPEDDDTLSILQLDE